MIIVDYQNDFVIENNTSDISLFIYKKLYNCRKSNIKILFTLDTYFDQNSKNISHTDILPENKRFIYGWQLYGKLEEMKSKTDIFISKFTFGSLELADYLISEQFDYIEFAGVLTNICVLANVVIAKCALPEAIISIDCKCVASNDLSLHKKALDVMESMGIELLNKNMT